MIRLLSGLLLGAGLAVAPACPQACARVLRVGPGAPYRTLAAAAAAAHDGDTVSIAAGDYAQCAVWRAARLTIQGTGADATVIRGPACQGKGLFVIVGRDATVRDLALVGAQVAEGNGAGIRAEGRGLTVERVRFEDDENGILTRDDPGATVIVRDSRFLRDGACRGACAHGIYAGRIRRLVVQHSSFLGTRIGHAIKSRARETEIAGCEIADGAEGSASYLVDIPDGGGLRLTGNRMQKGRHSANPDTAVALGEESARNPTPAIVVARNDFTNDTGAPTAFVRNRTATPAELAGNMLHGDVVPLVGPGSVR